MRRDRLILTSFGLKNLMEATGERRLFAPEHPVRCGDFFRQVNVAEIPKSITSSFSNVEFV
jgi:hypothetical protein